MTVRNLLADPVVAILFLCFVLAVAKFVSGSFRAWTNGVFEVTALRSWIKTEGDLLLPIVVWVLLAKAISYVDLSAVGAGLGLDPGALTTIGGGGLLAYAALQALTYITSTLAQVKNNLAPPDPAKVAAKVELAAAKGDPIPGTNPIPPTQ